MNQLIIPTEYKAKLSSYDLQRAIDFIKDKFRKQLEKKLTLKRVSAPLFVDSSSGLNDNLSGKERPVNFDIPALNCEAQVVHSLAKWKRLALKKYQFTMHEGLYTDMNAIRRDEELDNLHSLYVDQWDWEKIIEDGDRNLEYLKDTVKLIVECISFVSEEIKNEYPAIDIYLNKEVKFITSQELENLYPNLTPEKREHEYTKLYKTVFVMQIGDNLKSGKPHGNRAPDYDDWALNGDLLYWSDVLNCVVEISSMGIRVSPESLEKQLEKANCQDRKSMPFHSMLLNGELPLTIGGGIGQSRLCLLLLGCAHVGEVQVGLWDEKTINDCTKNGIPLL